MDRQGKYWIAIFIIGAVVFLFSLGGRDLWEPDETRYAVVAREMKETGDWVVPHLNGTIYTEKPPLFFWLVNLSTFFLGEVSEFANRLPSALAGLITMLMTFLLGTKLFNPRAGLLSGLVLGTCFFFPQISRWMMLDSLFSLFFLLAIYYLYLGINVPQKQTPYFLLAGIFMACGTLTKGPLGYLPIPILIIYSLMLKDIGKVWNRNLLYAGILSVGLVMAWFLPAAGIAGKSYGIQNLWRQTVGRFAGGWSHAQPFYFYFVRFPLGFLPWAIFLPWAVYDIFSRGFGEKKKEVLLLFVWFVFLFLFFSLSKGKKDNYLLPLYPAAAILVGKWLATFWGRLEESGETGGRLWIPMGLVTLLFAAGWLIILFRPFKSFPQEIETYFSFAVWPLFLIVLGGVLSLAFLLWRWSRLSVFSLVAVLVIAQVYVSIAIAPGFNELRSMKPFSRKILARMGANDDLKIWKFQSTGILYYTEKPVEQIKSIGHFLRTFHSADRVLMVVEGEDLDQLKKKVDVPIYPLERTEVGHRQLLLVSNRADR
jgi:hypothetical protein